MSTLFLAETLNMSTKFMFSCYVNNFHHFCPLDTKTKLQFPFPTKPSSEASEMPQ